MPYKLYTWPDGSKKLSYDDKGRDLVPLQIIPEELKKATVIEISIPELKMAVGQ